jgi:biopolymer transport protein TolR
VRRILSFSLLIAAVAAAQTPVLRKGVSVQMPVTANGVPMPGADSADSVVVAVTSGGVMYLEVTRVTPAELAEQMRAQVAEHPGNKVYLKSDERTPYSSVAHALSAVRNAGMNEVGLLTAQPHPAQTSYVIPTGLQVLIAPPGPDTRESVTVRIGPGQISDEDLKQRVQQARSVLLEVDPTVPFGSAIHAVDVCRGAGIRVYLLPTD